MGASGAIELVASLLSLRESTVPPIIGLEQVDDEALIDVVVGERRLAVSGPVLSNSFAFGGHNTSLVIA
jgi:3-oxoacyl-[acyl-carrier-protein] synthase II